MTDVIQIEAPVKIIVNVKKSDGTPKDLTGASNLKIKLRPTLPRRKGKIFTAVEENLQEGSISYTASNTDINALGEWKAQAYYELGGDQVHTRPEVVFLVEENLA